MSNMLSVWFPTKEKEMLDFIREHHIRKQSDMIRYLVITEYNRVIELKRLSGKLEDEPK